ncbi:MAG TPA: flagellar hook-associated protein FlgK [Geodermatophilus sp.]|nr:flagellar hook-associated protein FlgK [Geodermatophilus sp.]
MSTFSGLNTATTALWAQRRGLDVTGQNIANVNTVGYSRQRVDLQAMGGNTVPAFFSVSHAVGGGVSADDVERIRDAFLEARAQQEHATSSRLTAEADALGQIEQALREPGDTGIQALLTEMWAGWEDVGNNPHEEPARGQLLERLDTLAGGLRSARASLDQQWDQTRENLQTLLIDVNNAVAAVAELNQAIQRATASGLPANELADRRDTLVLELAATIGATGRAGSDGTVDVVVGGITLVAGSTATRVGLAGATESGGVGSDAPRIVTVPGGATMRSGGTAEGQLAALVDIVPEYQQRLDALAAGIAAALNSAHAEGYGLDGAPGGAIFGGGASGTDPVTAANITLLVTDPRRVAASKVPGGALDGSHADAIAQLRLQPTGPDVSYRRLVVELGVQTSVVERNLGIQAVITAQVDASRESVAGVNLDEEMTNMLSFQHAYSAAGRLVTAIDETLDQLINRTGLVGR